MTIGLLLALAETVVPPGRRVPGADAAVMDRLQETLRDISPAVLTGWLGLARATDAAALATTGHRFASLPLGRRLEVLQRLDSNEITRNLLRGVIAPIKLAAFGDRAVHEALGCRFDLERPAAAERSRWADQIMPAWELASGSGLGAATQQEIECDVVVVGTGAGGAPIAAALAEQGLAVLLLEEGEHHTRQDFNGRPVDMMRRLYRDGGTTTAFGNTAIPIPVGRGVGGTTLINSGTCYRVPEHTLAGWRATSGIDDLTTDRLAPFYAEAERVLEVAPSTAAAIGPVGGVVARGCDVLGWSHHPIPRNAPGCDGQGLCCFGCPTDAKRSTNVSYVPKALTAGATLLTGARVDRVRVEHGRAVGVEVWATDPSAGASGVGGQAPARPFRVRARAVVLACGTFGTPVLLQRQGLALKSGQVGRNLSIHPATAALARFDEDLRSFESVPQGYAVDEFHDEGILFEGSSLPLELTAALTPGFGPSFTAMMDDAQRSTIFGFLVKDSSRGTVTAGPAGPGGASAPARPRIRYWLNSHDLALVRRGMGLLARMFFAAGAREVNPPVAGFERLRSLRDVERMEAARYPAHHIDLTAYHPVGTCRMGADPANSVVGPDHQSHEVPGLYICDGSVFPGSPGVNPQLTIMALALRAAGFVGRGLA